MRGDDGYLYSAAFVADLSAGYFTLDETMDLLKMPRSTFYEWMKTEGIQAVEIGKARLFRKDVIMGKRRSV